LPHTAPPMAFVNDTKSFVRIRSVMSGESIVVSSSNKGYDAHTVPCEFIILSRSGISYPDNFLVVLLLFHL